MALALDALAGSAPGGGGISQTWTHTTGTGANRLMVVCAGSNAALLPLTVTYGGTGLTHLVSASTGSSSTDRDADIWYMIAPPSGGASVVATYSEAPAGISGESVTFTGASQSAPFGTSASFTSASASEATTTTTSPSSALVLSFICARTTSAPAAPGSTLEWTLLGGTNVYGAGAFQSGGAGLTSEFTFSPADHCAMLAVPILAPSAAAPVRRSSSIVPVLVAMGGPA